MAIGTGEIGPIPEWVATPGSQRPAHLPVPLERWRGKAPPTLPQVWGPVAGCFMCSERRFHDDGHKTREEYERDHPGDHVVCVSGCTLVHDPGEPCGRYSHDTATGKTAEFRWNRETSAWDIFRESSPARGAAARVPVPTNTPESGGAPRTGKLLPSPIAPARALELLQTPEPVDHGNHLTETCGTCHAFACCGRPLEHRIWCGSVQGTWAQQPIYVDRFISCTPNDPCAPGYKCNAHAPKATVMLRDIERMNRELSSAPTVTMKVEVYQPIERCYYARPMKIGARLWTMEEYAEVARQRVEVCQQVDWESRMREFRDARLAERRSIVVRAYREWPTCRYGGTVNFGFFDEAGAMYGALQCVKCREGAAP